MKSTFVVGAATVFAAGGLYAAPIAAAGPEEDFLQNISGEGISWPGGKAQAVIDTGYAVCTDWDNGSTVDDEVSHLRSTTDWTDYQAQAFIGAATNNLCPQYLYKIG